MVSKFLLSQLESQLNFNSQCPASRMLIFHHDLDVIDDWLVSRKLKTGGNVARLSSLTSQHDKDDQLRMGTRRVRVILAPIGTSVAYFTKLAKKRNVHVMLNYDSWYDVSNSNNFYKSKFEFKFTVNPCLRYLERPAIDMAHKYGSYDREIDTILAEIDQDDFAKLRSVDRHYIGSEPAPFCYRVMDFISGMAQFITGCSSHDIETLIFSPNRAAYIRMSSWLDKQSKQNFAKTLANDGFKDWSATYPIVSSPEKRVIRANLMHFINRKDNIKSDYWKIFHLNGIMSTNSVNILSIDYHEPTLFANLARLGFTLISTKNSEISDIANVTLDDFDVRESLYRLDNYTSAPMNIAAGKVHVTDLETFDAYSGKRFQGFGKYVRVSTINFIVNHFITESSNWSDGFATDDIIAKINMLGSEFESLAIDVPYGFSITHYVYSKLASIPEWADYWDKHYNSKGRYARQGRKKIHPVNGLRVINGMIMRQECNIQEKHRSYSDDDSGSDYFDGRRGTQLEYRMADSVMNDSNEHHIVFTDDFFHNISTFDDKSVAVGLFSISNFRNPKPVDAVRALRNKSFICIFPNARIFNLWGGSQGVSYVKKDRYITHSVNSERFKDHAVTPEEFLIFDDVVTMSLPDFITMSNTDHFGNVISLPGDIDPIYASRTDPLLNGWFVVMSSNFVKTKSQIWYNSQTHWARFTSIPMRNIFCFKEDDLHKIRGASVAMYFGFKKTRVLNDPKIDASVTILNTTHLISVSGHLINLLMYSHYGLIDFARYMSTIETNVRYHSDAKLSAEDKFALIHDLLAEDNNSQTIRHLWHSYFDFKMAVVTYIVMMKLMKVKFNYRAVNYVLIRLGEIKKRYPRFMDQSLDAIKYIRRERNWK